MLIFFSKFSLVDENEEVRTDIEPKWIKCGELYFTENENELGKLALIDHCPPNYMPNIKRPTIGCRAIMQRSLRMINIILHEMEEWKEEVRLHSLKLLVQAVVHCEKALTPLFMDIYPVLAKTCKDTDKTVANEAMRVAHIMGVLLDYSAWRAHALDGLKSHKHSHLGFLKCFTELYRGANDEKLDDFHQIVETLIEAKYCYNLMPEIQDQFIEFLELLADDFIRNKSEDDDLSKKYLYQNLVNLIAISIVNRSDIAENGRKILEQLNVDVRQLHQRYLAEMIETIEGLDSENSGGAEPILLLSGYIKFCGLDSKYMAQMLSAIKTVMESAQPDGKIQILVSLSISILNGIPENEPAVKLQLITDLIDQVIVPCLVWQAGRSAESIRSMATAVLCSISENAPSEAHQLMPIIVSTLTALVEDNNIATRSYALRCLCNCGPIPVDHIKPLALAVVSRFDDPSGEVRELAARCVGKLKVKAGEDVDGVWKAVIIHILSISVHHSEDPDIRMKASLTETLIALKAENQQLFDELLKEPKFTPIKGMLTLSKN